MRPGHGDDTLVAVAAASDEPVVLVSADRELAERVRRSGADVVGPTWLLERLGPLRSRPTMIGSAEPGGPTAC